MSFVYKYTDKSDGIVKYVGIVCRKGDNALHKRIREHFNTDKWASSHNWLVEYMEVKTKGDAHALEGHFITFYKTYEWFNKSKSDYGLLSFVDGNGFEWKEFDQDSDILNQYYEEFDEVAGWKAKEEFSSRFFNEKPRNMDQWICQQLKTYCDGENLLNRMRQTEKTILSLKEDGKTISGRDVDADLKLIRGGIQILAKEIDGFRYSMFGTREEG